MKRVFVFILLFLFTSVFVIWLPAQEAQAALPAVLAAANPEVLALVGALLVGAGMYFATDQGAQAEVWKAWETFSDATRNAIVGAASAAASTGKYSLTVTQEMYNELKDFLTAKYVGFLTWYSSKGEISFDYYTQSGKTLSVPANIAWFTGTFYLSKMSGTMSLNLSNGQTLSIGSRTVLEGGVYNTYFAVSLAGSVLWQMLLGTGTLSGFHTREIAVDFVSGKVYVDGNSVCAIPPGLTVNQWVVGYTSGSFDVVTGQSGTIAEGADVVFPQAEAPSVPVGSDVLIPRVQSLSDVVGKTAADLGVEVVAPSTTDSLLSDVVSGIRSLADTITAGLSDVVSAVRALPVAIGSALLDVAVGDTSMVLDRFDSLRLDFVEFTTKFPFSLPWDLKRALESLQASPSEMRFQVYLPLIGNFDLIPSFIFEFAEPVRKVFLVMFDIGMIFALRRLLGGAV